MEKLGLILFFTLIGFSSGFKIVKIGIIGGGIGGTSCAYFLRSLFAKERVLIDVFEAEKVGGRLSVVKFANKLYEEGGSIIHSRNKYMVDFLEEFNLHKRQTPTESYFALYDGKEFVFTESDWQMKTLWDVVYRYGLGFWKLRNYIEDMLGKFERIYDLQKRGHAYNTVQSLLAAMDPSFVNYLYVTTKGGFESQGISSVVVDEIIMATIRANYGQNLFIHKMVGSVSVAGAIGSLFAIDSGNFQVPQRLLKASRATLVKQKVNSIHKGTNGKLLLSTTIEKDIEESREYDIIIIATPQTSDSKYLIKFENFTEKINFNGKYHKTVCTLIEGTLCEKCFPGKSPIVDEILTTEDKVPFNSIGKITPVDYTPQKYNGSNVWKVFTQKVMTDEEISSLFSEVKSKYVREWLAYPHYETSFRNDSFVLAPNLYHINAIEWAASAMEMSVIGAKNVALLAYKKYLFDQGRGDEFFFQDEFATNSARSSMKEL